MKTAKMLAILVLVLGLMVCPAKVSEAAPMGTAFTYQGRLMDRNKAAEGLYDFQFKLYDDANTVTGNQVGSDVNVPDHDVIDGQFTVQLDFGSDVFDGNAVWLEIGVRSYDPCDVNAFTTLSPRQEVTPTPYALQTRGIFVDNAGNVGIGTTSPQEKLDVDGNINVNSVYKIGGDTVLSTLGPSNTFVGIESGANNTEGSYNAFLGTSAGYSNTTGYRNTFLGNYAGYSNITGCRNTFLGNYAGYYNTTGYRNTFVGNFAGYFNTTGNYNTFSGYQAGYFNTTGLDNTFLGHYTGYNNTTGRGNTFLGKSVGCSNSEGNYNTFLGHYAGYDNTTGGGNTFVGDDAGRSNTEGDDNTFVGSKAGRSNTTGYYNTFVGLRAGIFNTTGYSNTFLGYYAGRSNQTGDGNVFIGHNAGFNETGSNKLYIANGPSDANVLIYGDFSTGNVGIGTTSPLSKLSVGGDGSADVGVYGIGSDTGVYGEDSTSGAYGRLGYGPTGVWGAGSNYGVIGEGAAYGVKGTDSDTGSYGRLGNDNWGGYFGGDGYFSGNVGIGTTSPGSYKLYVQGTAYSTGGWQSSDLQFKENIKTIDSPIDKITNLKGVSFEWKTSEYKDKGFPEGRHYGVVAQDVEQVLPEIVKEGPDGDKAVSYTELIPILTEAIKEQQQQIETLRYEIKALKETIQQQQFAVAKEVQQ